MTELLCPNCGKTFPNSPPHRRTGRFVGDMAVCPNCGNQTRDPSTWIKQQNTPGQGIGVQLQAGPNSATPAQLALQQMNQMAQKLDAKGFYKLADRLDNVTVEFGKEGLDNSWQKKFPSTTKCKHCGGNARIAFTLIEDGENNNQKICDLHHNDGKGDYWLHDAGAFAVYLCKDCLEASALYNQA